MTYAAAEIRWIWEEMSNLQELTRMSLSRFGLPMVCKLQAVSYAQTLLTVLESARLSHQFNRHSVPIGYLSQVEPFDQRCLNVLDQRCWIRSSGFIQWVALIYWKLFLISALISSNGQAILGQFVLKEQSENKQKRIKSVVNSFFFPNASSDWTFSFSCMFWG